MKKHSLLKRVAAAAALSATIAVPGVVGFTAATANAKPMCEIIFEQGEGQAAAYHAARAAGWTADAQFWHKEFRLTQAGWMRHKCGH